EPMQFNGGWQSVLRFVRDWKLLPSSEEIWLALEDFWVQREVLWAINQVNYNAAQFSLVPSDKKEKDDPLHRKFQSRIWEGELWVENEAKGGGKLIKGKIKNRTDRLQTLGIGNRMVLRVWLSEQAAKDDAELAAKGDPLVNCVEFPVEGEFIPGGKQEDIRFL